MREGALVWRHIPALVESTRAGEGGGGGFMEQGLGGGVGIGVPDSSQGLPASRGPFASLVVLGGKSAATSKEDRRVSAVPAAGSRGDADAGTVDGEDNKSWPSTEQFLKHPLALLALVPKDAALFAAGAAAGAVAKTVTAPLDRIKLLMQVRAHDAPFPQLSCKDVAYSFTDNVLSADIR